MTDSLLKAMDKTIAPLQTIETIELSVLFFWKYRSGKMHGLSMQDLFDMEDVFKRYAEQRWLLVLRKNRTTVMSPNSSAGVGYKLQSAMKGAYQSGGMEIFVSQDLEDAMENHNAHEVKSHRNYRIPDPVPQPHTAVSQHEQGVVLV
jgi:hypothetical protein